MWLELTLFILTVVLGLAAVEQWSFYRKRAWLPGPASAPPFIGYIVDMVKRPFDFYEEQRRYGNMSWTSILGRFFLFVNDGETMRKVFNNMGDAFRLQLTLSAPIMLGKDKNIAYMNGPAHKALRKMLLPLFTRSALGVYLSIQEATILEHLDHWIRRGSVDSDTFVEMRPRIRDMNVHTSYKVFVGPYIKDDAMMENMSQLYFKLNEGFLALPISLPGTTLWYAVKAREQLIDILKTMVAASRDHIANDGDVRCLLDVWMRAVKVADVMDEGEEAAEITAKHNTEEEIAYHLLDFLFASQDASTSSLVWMVQLLHDHPDVREKMVEEQRIVRPNNEPLSTENIETMTYANQVVREVLRYRPPVTMVPHVAVKDCQLTSDYKVKKGTIVIPYLWAPQHEDFEEGTSFRPDRWSPEKRTEAHGKSFLVFGHGPHVCLGQRYAMNHLVAFAALLVTRTKWTRKVTESGDKIIYLPTIYPADGCMVNVQPA
eukprot:scpid52079/ scgid24965/ Probable cytochrome P450 524A1